jgi:hypothetical protein
LCIVAAAALSFFRNGGDRPATLCHRVLGITCDITSDQFAGNRLVNYLYFDTRVFLSEPFLWAEPSSTAQNYFWNALLKSSLMLTQAGFDREINYPLNVEISTGLSFLLLAMVVYALVGALSVTLDEVRRHGVLLVASVAWLSLLVAFRLVFPTVYHEDFRHVFPLVIPASLFYAKVVDRYRRRQPALGWVGYGLCLTFLLLSVLFFAPKHRLIRTSGPTSERPSARLVVDVADSAGRFDRQRGTIAGFGTSLGRVQSRPS